MFKQIIQQEKKDIFYFSRLMAPLFGIEVSKFHLCFFEVRGFERLTKIPSQTYLEYDGFTYDLNSRIFYTSKYVSQDKLMAMAVLNLMSL